MKNLMWYTKGLNSYLSSNGFVHYSVKEPIESDFTEGRAFFFDDEEKTLGMVDMIPNEKLDTARSLTSEFRDSGSIELVEDTKLLSEV